MTRASQGILRHLKSWIFFVC